MGSPVPHIVVAPDSFKGSCSAVDAARAITRGVRAVLGDDSVVLEVPMADGGEGSLNALVASWGGEMTEVGCTDALGRPRTGRVGFRGSGSHNPHPTASHPGGNEANPARGLAIIEAADANGLPAVTDQPLRPLDADSAGVGTLILAALDGGATEILLCLGGSATNDGGAGMLRALGAKLLDSDGHNIAAGARGLTRLAHIDLSNFDPRALRVRWRIACDVDNPLVGPRGAAAVFGPQKGAGAAEIEHIDAGLAQLAAVLGRISVGADRDPEPQTLTATDFTVRPGLGAAGGLALGLVALCGAELVPGAQLLADAVGLGAATARADLVITGEGRLDAQSLDGKVVSQVLAAAGGVPVIVLAGSLDLTAAEQRMAGITAAFSIAPGAATLTELQHRCPELLADLAARACSLASPHLNR